MQDIHAHTELAFPTSLPQSSTNCGRSDMKYLEITLGGFALAAFFFAAMWLLPIAFVAMGGNPQ